MTRQPTPDHGWLKDLPTTQAKALAAIVAFLGTMVKVWVSDKWSPSEGVITLILGFAGIAAAQHFGKRKTEFRHKGELPTKGGS